MDINDTAALDDARHAAPALRGPIAARPRELAGWTWRIPFDGQYLYVGNFIDQDISILKVDGTTVTNTGKTLKLPGHPASMRGRAQ